MILNIFWVDKISPKCEEKIGTVTLTKAFLKFLEKKLLNQESQGFELGSPDL
jgi:hypothetical protein